jgi:hypothetical protein
MRGLRSQNNRILALIAALAVASFVVGGLVYAVSSDQAAELASKTTRITRLDALANEISTDIDYAEGALGDYVLSGAEIARQRFNDAVDKETAAADDFRGIAAGMETVLAALDRVEAASVDWRDRVAGPAIRAIRSSDSAGVETYRD